MVTLTGLLLAVLLIGYWLIPESTSMEPVNNKIAVLPLESISSDPEDIQFTDGVHEELINRLAGISDLTVIARSSVRGFEPGERDLRSIGEQLDVSSLMEGTVRRIGEELRVSIQLIDVNSLGTIWSGSFDENLDNVFELQSHIARQVAVELQASLTPEEEKRLDDRPTDNPEAYRLYMLGQEYTTFENEDRLLVAEEYYKLAIEEDPDFTHAWAKLAGVNHILYWRYERTPERREALESAAKKAEALDPDLPETKLAMGKFYSWTQTDHRQSLNYFLSALEQFPNEHTLHREIGYVYRHMGNWEMSIKYWERSIELNPVGLLSAGVAYNYWLLRNYDKALTYLDNLKEGRPESVLYFAYKAKTILSKDGTLEGYEQWWDHLRPSDPSIEQTEYWIEYKVLKRDWNEIILTLQNIQGKILINDEVEYLLKDYLFGRAIERQGNNSEARVYYERAKNHLEALVDEYPDEARYHSELGKVYARLGDVQKAIRSGERATQIIPISLNAVVGPNFEMNLAEIYAWTGQEDLAIDKLELCLSVPSVAHRNWIRLDPRWDPLRDNPRFQELIADEDEPFIERL